VFPFQLRVGNVIDDLGAFALVVEWPTTSSGVKMTRAWVRREGAAVKSEILWENWRRVRVVKRAAA
jgi:hypothetical protein